MYVALLGIYYKFKIKVKNYFPDMILVVFKK